MEEIKTTRREREKERQRQEILGVALGLFSEKGYHNVSMHEIAEKAEFAIGTLYKFFENKEELYKALVMEMSERFHRAFLEAIEAPGDEVEKLRRFIRSKGENFRAHLPFIRLYLAETRGASFNIKAGMDAELRKRYDAILEKLALVMESGIKNRRFNALATPYQLATALDSVVNSFHLLWLETPERHPNPENPDTILNIFFQGLLNP